MVIAAAGCAAAGASGKCVGASTTSQSNVGFSWGSVKSGYELQVSSQIRTCLLD
jgi:hypothetical protein